MDKYSIQWSIWVLEKGGFHSFLLIPNPFSLVCWGLPPWKPARDPDFWTRGAQRRYPLKEHRSLRNVGVPGDRWAPEITGAKLRGCLETFGKKNGKNNEKPEVPAEFATDNFFVATTFDVIRVDSHGRICRWWLGIFSSTGFSGQIPWVKRWSSPPICCRF